jgi:hypothetical protein
LIRRQRAEKIRIALRQGQDRVQMVRKDYDRIDCKWTFASPGAERGTQCRDMIDEKRRAPVR